MSDLLIDAIQLARMLEQPDTLVLDVRYDLFNPAAGRQAYEHSHIPGAVFVELEKVMSGPKNGRNGRHPLPDRSAFVQSMRQLGLTPSTRVIIYDAANSMAASRLWWMLRWIGHTQIQVLDGGWAAWLEAGQVVETQPMRFAEPVQSLAVAVPDDTPPAMPAYNVEFIEAHLNDPQWRLLDARAPERYRGETEPIDPVAGHIPGALNWPNSRNLAANNRFRPAHELRADYLALLKEHPVDRLIHQCGSGISACHNLLAMEVAGLPGSALYVGSWSEWCSDSRRPIATGNEPQA